MEIGLQLFLILLTFEAVSVYGIFKPIELNLTSSLGNLLPVKDANLKNPIHLNAGLGIKFGNACGKLPTPLNSESVCNAASCRVSCKPGYRTVSGKDAISYVCNKESQWVNEQTGKLVVEKCEPECYPGCQNGGECVMPNLCQCGMNFYGPSCEFEKIPCQFVPATPLFALKKCQADNCTITCMPGKEFPDGSTSVQLFCDKGKWISTRSEWSTIPNCQAICSPPCRNGGKCIDTSTCFCPEDFRGKQCQHPVSNCDASKLNFNGNYNCNGDEEQFSCRLSCPGNAASTKPFEANYTCKYSEGLFKPSDIPQCQIGKVIDSTKISHYNSKWRSTSSVATTCVLWNARYLKALNNQIFNFKKANCIYTLIQDDLEHLFHVQVEMSENVIRRLIIYINDMKYELSKTADGKPILISGGNENPLTIPCQLSDLKVEIGSGVSVVVSLPATNLHLIWSQKGEIQVDVSAEFFNRTTGLCGRGSTSLVPPANLQTHFKNAAVVSLAEQCNHVVEDPGFCEGSNFDNAIDACDRMFKSGPIFEQCNSIVPSTVTEEYINSCLWSYCNSDDEDNVEGICLPASKYVQTCSQISPGKNIDWRKEVNCSTKCPPNQIHTNCVPVSQATCTANEILPSGLQKYCQEGCICKPGYVLHEDECIKKENCPCIYGGKFYESKSVIPKDCNKCTCISGKWSCTEAACRAQCSLYSGLHYKTFDGKKFDFSAGSCSHTLLATDNVNVAIEYSTGVNLRNSREPRRLKTFLIRAGKKTIALKETNEILVNNREAEALPVSLNDEVRIRKASTFLTEVTLPDGIQLLWNGEDELQIFVNSSMLGKTKGLCGTFNNNQQDDFLTPEGDVEHDVRAFANSWKTNEQCVSETLFEWSTACEVFVQNKPLAESFCKNLTSDVFKNCNAVVDANDYYETCLTDMCACGESELAKCLCPSLSAYAEECARRGVVVDWRKEIRICGVQCNVGQRFEACGSSCQRSCSDISNQVMCQGSCVEGCYCAPGYTLDENDFCVPIGECSCLHNGQKHAVGYVSLRNKTGKVQACDCRNGAWECRLASPQEMKTFQVKKGCPSANMEYIDCEPPEPITCKNMHNPPQFSPKTCIPGCVCKEGFVLESVTKKCVKASECPCHHGSRSYADGEIIHQDCNNCTCSRGRWKCSNKECPATCTTWGDSHFRTFDGKFFDFQGTCDYVFAKGRLSNDEAFSIAVQIVPCGSGGISCTKSVTITVGSEDDAESVTLDKEVDVYSRKAFKKFDVLSTGLYVVVMIRGLSVTLQWDKGTRVSLHIHPKWKNTLSGLCGNYNGNGLDDFQTPSGGLVEVSPITFADSWKLQQHCPAPYEVQDTCLIHPNRKFWSVKKCSQLKVDPIFQQCHSQVPVEDFYKRCVFDSCACDQGGDCECLCTAFAAYAQECNAKGVPLKWRRQDICPVQCEPGTAYSACISSCPVPSCSNLGILDSMMENCRELPCVEGCQPTICPAGEILRNSTSLECVAPANCECMNLNGQIFKESEKIYEDECHSCYCSKGKKVCTGLPCKPSEKLVPPSSLESTCVSGWSDWLPIPKNKEIVLQKTKAIKLFNFTCPANGMLEVQCRKKSGLFLRSAWTEADCHFEKLISCSKPCHELQIRIKCDCNAGPLIELLGNDTVRTPPPKVEVVEECNINCDQLCHHYQHELEENDRCNDVQKCIAGLANVTCPKGMYWRDEATCVFADACTCASHNGSLVKPSVFIEEGDCSICQCINNEYVCTPASCPRTKRPDLSTTLETTSATPEFITPVLPVTPLPMCSSDRLVPIDEEATYKASSISMESLFEESDLRPNRKAWRALIVDDDQYLDVDLGHVQPVYGIEVAGDGENGEYVKSYKVLYSSDATSYSYAEPASSDSKVFRGPHDHKSAERQLFDAPFEARHLRIRPILWQKWISMRVRIMGCPFQEASSTPSSVCAQPMGLDSGRMHPSQVSVSSALLANFTPADASLSSSSGWAPFFASSDQFIQFDFLDERIIDGVKTKGTDSLVGDKAWVEAYTIRYSLDGVNWNKVLQQDKNEKIFSANYDHSHAHSSVFSPPLRARYLRVYPVRWENFPSFRVEVLGCFEPYPEISTTISPEIKPLFSECNLCRGIISRDCDCAEGTFWNGVACVKKEFCPCVEGLLTYDVGSTYMKAGCEKCVCSLGGLSTCHAAAKDCPNCAEQGLLKVVNDDCTCDCKPCALGTRLCSTSNICLDETLWCNGFKECADDETDCPPIGSSTTPRIIVPTSTAPPTTAVCPPPTCPEGYTAVFSQLKSKTKDRAVTKYTRNEATLKALSFNETVSLYSRVEENSAYESSSLSIVQTTGKMSENCSEYINMGKRQYEHMEHLECRDWTCVPSGVTCSKPVCPPGTKLIAKWTTEDCPAYECTVPPATEKECTVSGRMVSTFDGTSFKYDICDHLLARDKVFNTWSVRRVTKCPYMGPCVLSLIVKHDNDVIELFTNFTASYNDYKYSIPQLQAIGSRTKLFSVQPISTVNVIFASADLKFNIIWGSDGYTKIIIESSLHDMVDGLCGYFDFVAQNDKRKPDGTAASSTQEFGDSWKVGNDICEAKVCPKDVQVKATDICGVFKQDPFEMCDFTLNIEEQVAKCYESICSCAITSENFDADCRCQVLTLFATKCLASQPGVDLSMWRLKHGCPVNCTAPFVYRDCYDRACEPDCDSLLQADRCPRIPDRCFPGCYCPEGLIRKGDTCILPSECRDCVCSSNGLSQFTTFDRVQVPFASTCSSNILLQTNKTTDRLDNDLQIIVTNAPCLSPQLKGICPHSLTVIFDSKVVLLAQSSNLNEAHVRVDSTTIDKFPFVDDSMKITETVGKFVKLSIPSIQLDVTFRVHNKGFLIQLPSSMYSDKLQGLCGTCNLEPTDDIETPTGEVAEKLTDFLESWQTNYAADTDKLSCYEFVQKVEENFTVECVIPGKNDPCKILFKKSTFGQCHAIVDPSEYVNLCHKQICRGASHCNALEAYVEECQRNGVCIEWRDPNTCPYSCPEGFVYEACSMGCEVNCDSYKQLRETPEWCAEPLREKCVCPEGQVLSNGVCINELRCRPCDEHDHFFGDKWSPNNCTRCECSKDGSVSCHSRQCPTEIVCPMGMKAEIDKNNDDPCCEKHVCVPEETKLTCPEPVKIECGKDQLVKLDVTADNCTHYICVCVPREECPKLEANSSVELLPGMVRREKKEGCCPSVELICDTSVCPEPVECPQYYVRREEKFAHLCCPVFTCERPPNSCVHEYRWIADYNVSERARLPSERMTELKQVGDTWFDGPCHLCICTNDSAKGVCNEIECQVPAERENYVVTSSLSFGDCCPMYKIVACKWHGIVHKVNDTWAVENEPCKTMMCDENVRTAEISIKEIVQSCPKECEIGWNYTEPETDRECCGSCRQYACVDGIGMLRLANSTWKSDDGCVKFECDHEFKVIGYSETCPSLYDCPEEYVYEDGCCKRCNKTGQDQLNCVAVSVPLNDTIGLIKKLDSVHGQCVNVEEIRGFSRCDGFCSSSPFFSETSLHYDSDCSCCLASDFEEMQIELTCTNGQKIQQIVHVPSMCECQSGCNRNRGRSQLMAESPIKLG